MIDTVALRRARFATSPVALRGAFRLFFLCGPIWVVVVVTLWLATLAGAISLPSAMDPLAWHQHEMLFGYFGAIIAGFLSAAIPNWTGRPAFAGWPVVLGVGLWLAARFAILFSATVTPLLAAGLDLAFLLLVALAAGHEIVAARNRNVPIIFVVLCFVLASGLHHAETMGAPVASGLGIRLGFTLVLILIMLIGGRIIPAFTRNWLVQEGLAHHAPAAPGKFDALAIGVAALALTSWTAVPGNPVVGALLIAAGLLHMARLFRWSGIWAIRDPLVLILHVSYAWLPLGLVLLGAAHLTTMVPISSAIHTLAAGAMTSMTLAVMTRATLGHTGRRLAADATTIVLYLLVTVGAALRAANPILPFDPMTTLRIAGVCWSSAFLLFIFAYGPKLLGPRVDGQP